MAEEGAGAEAGAAEGVVAAVEEGVEDEVRWTPQKPAATRQDAASAGETDLRR
jgi:hypothetical protein